MYGVDSHSEKRYGMKMNNLKKTKFEQLLCFTIHMHVKKRDMCDVCAALLLCIEKKDWKFLLLLYRLLFCYISCTLHTHTYLSVYLAIYRQQKCGNENIFFLKKF